MENHHEEAFRTSCGARKLVKEPNLVRGSNDNFMFKEIFGGNVEPHFHFLLTLFIAGIIC